MHKDSRRGLLKGIPGTEDMTPSILLSSFFHELGVLFAFLHNSLGL